MGMKPPAYGGVFFSHLVLAETMPGSWSRDWLRGAVLC